MKVVKCKTKKEWLKARKISATRMSAILNEHPYMTKNKAYKIIKGIDEEDNLDENLQVQFGIKAEKIIRELFALENEKVYQVIDPPDFDTTGYKEVYVKSDNKLLTASNDGFLIDLETGLKGVLEIKTAELYTNKKWAEWDNQVPQHYYIQLLHEMNVCEVDFGVLVAYLKGLREKVIRVYRIEKSEKLEEIAFLNEKANEFITDYLDKNIEPPIVLDL